jgi:hypothetical protein
MPRQLIAIGLLVIGGAAAAEPATLSGQALKDAVTGATIEIDTPIGTKVPIRYHEDGSMTGEAGAVAYFLGGATDRGRWWVMNDQLCQKWSKWLDAETHCMVLRRRGRQVNWRREDGKTGTATLISRPAQVAQRVGPPSGLGLEQPAARMLEAPPPPSPRMTSPEVVAPAESEPPKAPRPVIAPQARSVVPSAPAQPQPVKPKPASAQVNAPTPPAPAQQAAHAAPPQAMTPAMPRLEPRGVPVGPTFRVAGVAPADVLNVRSGPSAEHIPVGAIAPGARDVRVVGPCQQEWCPVEHRGIGGWVNSYYLAAERPVRSAPSTGGPTPP